MFKRTYPIAGLKNFKDLEIDKIGYFKLLVKNMCYYPKKKHVYYIGKYYNSSHSNVSNYESAIKLHYFYNNKKVGISTVAINYLNSIIHLCKERKIKIILLVCPLHKEYLKRIPSNFIKKFNELKNKLANKGLIILDYSHAVFNDVDFLNTDHLNKTGADKFTKMLKPQLKTLLKNIEQT
jgi:hypothetical protein